MIFVLEEFGLNPIKVCITNSMKTEPFRLSVELLCIYHAFDRPDLVHGEVGQPLWVCRGVHCPSRLTIDGFKRSGIQIISLTIDQRI